MEVNDKDLKLVLHTALNEAKACGHEVKDIASEIGVSPRALYDLTAKLSITYANAERLKIWLRTHGYLSPETSVRTPIKLEHTEFGLEITKLEREVFDETFIRQTLCLPSVYSEPNHEINYYSAPGYTAERLRNVLVAAKKIQDQDVNAEHDWKWRLEDTLTNITKALRDIEDLVADMVRIEKELLSAQPEVKK